VTNSETGYPLHTSVYCGEISGHSHDVVKDLMTKAGLLNKGYHLLTTFTLEHLHTQQTPMTGTLRVKRKGVPNLLKDAKPKEQECAYFRKGDLLALSWRE